MYIYVIVFFKSVFINRADRDVTFRLESDYSLSVVFTCIANISINFSASE